MKWWHKLCFQLHKGLKELGVEKWQGTNLPSEWMCGWWVGCQHKSGPHYYGCTLISSAVSLKKNSREHQVFHTKEKIQKRTGHFNTSRWCMRGIWNEPIYSLKIHTEKINHIGGRLYLIFICCFYIYSKDNGKKKWPTTVLWNVKNI